MTVTIEGLAGYAGHDLAGVLHRDSDGLVVGGFSALVDSDDFTTTQVVRRSDSTQMTQGSWPYVTEEVLVADPGRYTVTLWADTSLGAYNRWLPLNSDGQGLAGCVFSFDVAEEVRTELVLDGQLWTTGYLGVCEEAGGGTEQAGTG